MAHEIRTARDGYAGFTQTCASLPAGNARQATFLTNSLARGAALIFYSLKPAVAPTAGTVYEIFLLRENDGAQRTDAAGSSDAGITIINAQLIGTLQVTNATSNFRDAWDTAPLGKLGNKWATAVRNSTNQALDATEGNHVKQYDYYLPSVQ